MEEPLQEWKMVLHIYQLQMYQKISPITKYTETTQKSPNLSYQLENIKSLLRKSTKSKKTIKTLGLPLQYSEMGLPTNQIETYQKVLPVIKYADIN